MAPGAGQRDPRSTSFLCGGDQASLGTGRESTVGDKPTQRDLFLARIQRRRNLAASLNIPAGLEEVFVKFTRPGGLAVLKIISGEVVKHGSCTLTVDAIADVAGIDRSVVKVALRTAKAEGLIKVEQGHRYNTITVSATWKAWLDRYGDAPRDGSRGSVTDGR
jgi:hypothetical protein